MPPNIGVNAVIWDFDGTLVDTRARNLSVTRRIVESLTGKAAATFAALRTLEDYDRALQRSTNWRDLYAAEFRLSERETDDAASLWSEYHSMDQTPMALYPGIDTALRALSDLPQGIVSQNSRALIAGVLDRGELLECFAFIVGYDNVDVRRQKPEPDGLLACIEQLTGLAPGYVLYVGDHQTDVRCASRANDVLRERGVDAQVLSVAALYGTHNDDTGWEVKPDYRATRPRDILDIVQRVPSR